MGVQNCTESNKATNAILITDHHNCGLPLTVDAFCSQDPLQNIAFFQKQDTNKYGNTFKKMDS